MYRENAYKEIRNVIIKRFADTDLNDFAEFNNWLQPHLTVLNELKRLSEVGDFEPSQTNCSNKTENINSEKTEDEPTEDQLVDDGQTEKEEDELYPIGHTFSIQKKALGAVIRELNYPIAEELVRSMQIENGNKVLIKSKGTFPNGGPKYTFEVTDRTEEPCPLLMEVKNGIVERVAGRLIVQKTYQGDIRIDGVPTALYIKDADINRKNLQAGDVVDGRFYQNNVSSLRICHKHETTFMQNNESIESKKLTYRQTHPTETESGEKMIDRIDKTPFIGKQILLIGLGSRINDFYDTIKDVPEIDIMHLSGDENKLSIRSKINKADCVLISTIEMGHHISGYVANTCNTLNVPFSSTHAVGLTGILADAKKLILGI